MRKHLICWMRLNFKVYSLLKGVVIEVKKRYFLFVTIFIIIAICVLTVFLPQITEYLNYRIFTTKVDDSVTDKVHIIV